MENDFLLSRGLNRKTVIEMDRFVHTLTGQAKETIRRESKQSAATMKEQGTTIEE